VRSTAESAMVGAQDVPVVWLPGFSRVRGGEVKCECVACLRGLYASLYLVPGSSRWWVCAALYVGGGWKGQYELCELLRANQALPVVRLNGSAALCG
jgi:hypothetical protein